MTANEDAWIETVQMRSFKGIVGPLGVDLAHPRRSGSVLFVFGDNGTGKSSICDSIEFLTRGVLSRRLQGGQKTRREVRNLSSNDAPSVYMRLSNGDEYVRGTPHGPAWTPSKPGVVRLTRADTLKGFDTAPVVIRRDAVESFWRIPATSRLDYFWDYLRPPGAHIRTTADEALLKEHHEVQRGLRAAKRELIHLIPRTTWPARFQLPTHSATAGSALNAALQHSRATRKLRGKSSREETRAIRAYVALLKNDEKLRHDAAEARSRAPRDTRHLRALLATIGPRVTSDFFGMYGQDWISDIKFTVDSDGSLNVALISESGSSVRPEDVLSEAGLDVLSLIIAVELHVAAATLGQTRVLIFDDVFQSVDSVLRKRIVDHLAKVLRGWQLVFSLHDRLWLEVIERAFNDERFATSIVELRGGGFGLTPRMIGSGTGPLRDLEASVASGASPVVLAAVAGRALEDLAERLSVVFAVAVRRKERDRYEIGDLWPAVKDVIDESSITQAKALASTMNHSQFLRNRVGAHANDWADGLTDAEATQSADNVAALWRSFLCPSCGRIGKRSSSKTGWTMVFKCCAATSSS